MELESIEVQEILLYAGLVISRFTVIMLIIIAEILITLLLLLYPNKNLPSIAYYSCVITFAITLVLVLSDVVGIYGRFFIL